MRAVIGLDGGSTSSKAVLVDHETGQILVKAYQLSKGNPIQDTKELLAELKEGVEKQGATLEVTGYAADVLEQCVRSDVNVVETVAHMMSAVHFFGDIDVICDIGGQDIKVLFMKNGDIANFRLSNSCSAGNGMLLQATAVSFGVPVTQFADVAFAAELAPKFSYGCAVFLDTDRVNFQKEGFSKEEMLAGLAQVLPKNVWQYVVQIPRMAALGTKYVLQGGTQYNLAALKAQVDYIKERVPTAEVFVHPHTDEAGAIGAAMETLRVVKRKGRSSFIGLEAAINLDYTTKNDEETVCHFCENNCKRTFIDTTRPDGSTSRYIAGFSCEKGTVESEQAMLDLVAERKKVAKEFPNLVDYEANLLFKKHAPEDKKPLKYIFFPILTHVHNFVVDTMDNASCPIVAGAPDVMKAAFTKLDGARVERDRPAGEARRGAQRDREAGHGGAGCARVAPGQAGNVVGHRRREDRRPARRQPEGARREADSRRRGGARRGVAAGLGLPVRHDPPLTTLVRGGS